jgi:hypothetical protein
VITWLHGITSQKIVAFKFFCDFCGCRQRVVAFCITDGCRTKKHRTGWSRLNALNLYSRGTWFESRPGYCLYWPICRRFFQPQTNAGLVPRLGPYRFLPNLF